MVKYMYWTTSLRETALSTIRGSLGSMFENYFVFDLVTVLFTSGAVSSNKT